MFHQQVDKLDTIFQRLFKILITDNRRIIKTLKICGLFLIILWIQNWTYEANEPYIEKHKQFTETNPWLLS